MTEITTATVTSLDAARRRRYYIELANNHPAWQQIVASWALEGIIATDDNAEQAGRMIAGEITYAQISTVHGTPVPPQELHPPVKN
ncbi:antitoxin VbhA family protein [Pseudoduganella rhizocola]|uniref:antitoxin VbhA family protein n=1 Tax=Pseudoduganella rhizocola TaxID=3382643 RepID=UPI0038B49C91